MRAARRVWRAQRFFMLLSRLDCVDLQEVAEALGGRLAGYKKLGGLANECYRIDVRSGRGLERFAVKLYRGGDAADKARRELELFKAMPSYGLSSPRVVLADLEGRLAGRPLLVWRWIDGVTADRVMGKAATRRTVARALGAALARLHSVRLDDLEPGLFAQRGDFWKSEAEALRFLAKLAGREGERALELAEEVEALPTERVALIHGDYNPGNVLVGGGGVYVMDLEGAQLGDPEYDVAYACLFIAFSAGVSAARDFALEYYRLSGLKPSNLALKMAATAAKLRLLLGSGFVRAIVREKAGLLTPLLELLFLKPLRRYLGSVASEHALGGRGA